jgi:predicted phosphodiesterase
MKKYYWISIALFVLLSLIFLFPWFELFLLFVLLILSWSYNHYWKDKPYYGPYLQFGESISTEMKINWIAVDPKYFRSKESCWIEFSEIHNFGENSSNSRLYCKEIIHLKDRTDTQKRVYYHFLLSNLEPQKKYYYRIGIAQPDDIIFQGKKFFFTTGLTPSDKDDSFKIIIYGDDQTADFVPVLAQRMNHLQYNDKPQFIVHLGDINQNLAKFEENNAFFQTKKKLFRTIPYMPVIGNHDVKPTMAYYHAIYDIKPWYSFDFGQYIRVVVISGYDLYRPNTNGQFEFIEKNLKEISEQNRYALICVHEGPYNIEIRSEEDAPIAEMREFVVPLLEKYNRGIQSNIVVFSGHKHTYERAVRNSVTYLTVGACSNAKSYSKLESKNGVEFLRNNVDFEYGKQSYALITLDGKKLVIKIKNIFNKVVETLKFSVQNELN